MINDLLKDLESDLSHRLFEMAKDDASLVTTDGKIVLPDLLTSNRLSSPRAYGSSQLS